MFVLRQARISDIKPLLKLARTVHFINLPPDPAMITKKVETSSASFEAARSGAAKDHPQDDPRRSQYMFTLEDTSTGAMLGTSSIIAEIGSPAYPNLALQLRKESFFSQDLRAGATHVTAQLVIDEDGPTEIGGLIITPSHRRHALKLGRQLSLVRFHFIGLHRERFKDQLLAEMMGAITGDEGNTLWEYFGRRFINLSFKEADLFSLKSREFMISLFPHEKLYLTMLPPEAKALIGRVSDETRPARAMLESLGFAYRDRVDPFDGGPHLEVATDDVDLVKATRRLSLSGVFDERAMADPVTSYGVVSTEEGGEEKEFRAVYTWCQVSDDSQSVKLPSEAFAALGVESGVTLGFTPMPAMRPAQHDETGAATTAMEKAAGKEHAK